MFAGIIQAIGKVKNINKIKENKGDLEITLEITADFATNAKLGDSIAVNGICLTVAKKQINKLTAELTFDVSAHTVKHTNIGKLATGSPVNIEPSLSFGAAVHGHFVYGHVDCTAEVKILEQPSKSWVLQIIMPADYKKLVCPRASIAIDGTSLTVADILQGNNKDKNKDILQIALISHTVENTISQFYKTGSLVNLEFDMLARYVAKQLST